METRRDLEQSSRLTARVQLAVVVAVVLFLRLPFLNQAIQGDDVDYLAGGEHAQMDPLHPTHARYVFMGDMVDMRGHPHPPLNVWCLALLLAAIGDVREIPFHAAYILFSLIAAIAMWSLARRFSPHPLWATLLFLAVPAFVVNGNSFESDIPFVAFWLAAVALFVAQTFLPVRFLWLLCALALALAAMTAFQAIFLTPILVAYAWLHARRSRTTWILILVPPLTIALWQIYERLSSGVMPAAVLTGYMNSYGWQAFQYKLRNAAALTMHSLWIVCPLLLPPAFLASWKRRDRDTIFLFAWIVIFFAGALVVFFAGSARYLLPMAAPACLLVSRIRPKWLTIGFALQMVLSLGLSVVNYQHWDGYRQFAASLQPYHRMWINSGLGLRFYLEARGGVALERRTVLRPGDVVVSSDLTYPVNFTHAGVMLTRVAQTEIRPAIPLRLIGLDTRSGYSTASEGLLPFGISTGPIDRVHADLLVDRKPTLEYLPMNAPEAAQQIVSGIYDLEGAAWRWMSGRAVILLKSPAEAMPLQVSFNIPSQSPARRVTLLLEEHEVATKTYSAPGSYTLQTSQQALKTPASTLTIVVDKVFSAPGDARQLGIVLNEAGFRK